MTVRFIPYAGEAFAGEYVDTPCSLCGDLICDCDDEYRDPEALRAWMRLTEDERQSRLAEAHAKIAAAFRREPIVDAPVTDIGGGWKRAAA